MTERQEFYPPESQDFCHASSSSDEGGLAVQALRFFFNKMSGQTPFENQIEQNRAVCATLNHVRGDDAATLFLEYPLAGEGGFDVHVYPVLNHACSSDSNYDEKSSLVSACSFDSDFDRESSRVSVCSLDSDFGRESSRVSKFLHWCEKQPARVTEGGCAYDLSAHGGTSCEIPEPCLYTAFFASDKSPVPRSFDAMGASQFTPALHDILSKLESDHSVYYTGAMYGRNPLVAHIGYKVKGATRRAYRSNPQLLFEHLEHMGFKDFDASCEAERFYPYANRGFSNDVQYAFDETGVIPDTLSFSYVPSLAPNKNRDSLSSGAIREVLEYLQNEVGVADSRWRALEHVLGSWVIPYHVSETIKIGVANVSVGYVKIGWKLGSGINRAKMYLSIQVAPI